MEISNFVTFWNITFYIGKYFSYFIEDIYGQKNGDRKKTSCSNSQYGFCTHRHIFILELLAYI